MKKFWKFIFKLIKKLVVIGFVGFVATFALYMFNGENKLIYYVVRPLLNKHYPLLPIGRRGIVSLSVCIFQHVE